MIIRINNNNLEAMDVKRTLKLAHLAMDLLDLRVGTEIHVYGSNCGIKSLMKTLNN